MNKYNADSIQVLDAIEGIRKNAGMYIGGTDSKAYQHLLLEIISNSIDEISNGFGNKVLIEINSSTQKVTITDWGRGIPNQQNSKGEEVMISIFTQTHSGGKFDRDGYASSIGTHGLGASAVNALSKEFHAVSIRDGYIAEFKAKQGRQTHFKRDKTSKKESQSIISFIPDSLIFKNSKWNKEEIKKTLKLLSYLTPNIEFKLIYDKEEFVYMSKEGLKDLIREKNKEEKTITEIVTIKDKFNGADVEIALQYTNTGKESVYAFTNGVQNIDGGTHITGFKGGFTSFINKKAKELGLLREDDDNFTGESIRKGMVAAIHIKLYEKPEFSSQTKDKLVNPSARASTSQAASSLPFSRKDLENIIEKTLLEKRAEDAAKRAREAAKKVVSGGRNLNRLKDLPEKLKDANQPGGELFVVEGDSAAGSAEIGRDPQTQAILPLKGKILNTHNKELAEIVESEEIKNILTSLGCGIGENFNINNLRYDKIILLSDADPDGGHINILLMTLFLRHLPQLIEAGKVYRAMSPLYRVRKGKKTEYLQNDDELEKYIKRNGQPTEITRFKGLGEQNPEELWDTTMNPETRTLVQLTTQSMERTLGLFNIMMGSDSSLRRTYIMKNTKEML